MTFGLKAAADGLSGTLQVGGVDIATFDSTGKLTLIGKIVQAVQSMVRLNTASGYGSTNTVIRRFTNVVTNQGSDITYADSATLGASFTINTAGVYSISYSDQFSAQSHLGISVNSTQLTTSLVLIAAADQLASATNGAANNVGSCSWTGYLPAGAVVRAHAGGTTTGTTVNAVQFSITRVS